MIPNLVFGGALNIRPALLASTIIVTWLCAGNAYAQQATYTLKATPKTVAWGYYDAKAAAVLRVKSGDAVCYEVESECSLT